MSKLFEFAPVADEAAALKLDGLVNEAHGKLAANKKDKAKGFLKTTRQVCKTEWAYELCFVFDSLDIPAT